MIHFKHYNNIICAFLHTAIGLIEKRNCDHSVLLAHRIYFINILTYYQFIQTPVFVIK